MTLVGVVDEESLGSFATNKPEVDVGLLVKNHVVVTKIINMKKKSDSFFFFFCRGCSGGCCWLGAWKEEMYLIEIFAKNCWLSSTEVRLERAFKYSFKECFFAKEFFDYYFLILGKHLKVDDRASAMHFKYLGCQKRFELLKKQNLSTNEEEKLIIYE